jgi:glycosyltransferase involved in cell wall biosynthesis
LFRELAQRVEVCVHFAHRATPQQQAEAGFETAFDWDVDLLGGYDHVFLRNVSRTPGAQHFSGCDTPEIGERLEVGRFNALLVIGWHLKSCWQGIWAAKRNGMPVLVRGDSHLQTPRKTLRRAAKRATYPVMLRVFDAALYVGRRNCRYYEYYRYPAERLFFSPHCVDTQRFSVSATSSARTNLRARLQLAHDDKVALFAGKLVDFKRPLDLVDAARLVRSQEQSLRVVVAGSGPLEEDMRRRAADAGVPVDILGFQNQTEMPAVYAAADVLALPSTGRETWGLVCNEALACSVPIVVSDQVGCAPDLASDGNVGRTFPVGDVEALAGALVKAMRSPPRKEEVRRVSDRYSVAAAADGVMEGVRRCV